MTNTTAPAIIGTVPPGTFATVDHAGHVHNGHKIIVGGSNGPTGGTAGGGAVKITCGTCHAHGTVSRYTRVVIES